MKVGECLLAGGPPGTAAEPEVIIGDLNGSFGTAFATLLGNQIKGHTKSFGTNEYRCNGKTRYDYG